MGKRLSLSCNERRKILNNLKHILLDFDHCLAEYRCDGMALDSNIIKKYSLMMDNRFKQMTFEQTSRDGNFWHPSEINAIIRYIVSYYKPNKKVLELIKSFQMIYPNIKISFASDSPINTIVQFLDLYDIDLKIEHYFTWETLNWKRKKDPDFYIQIRRSLDINFNEMILIDDSYRNLGIFENLGGQIFNVPATDNFTI